MTRFPEKFGLLVDLTECVLCLETRLEGKKRWISFSCILFNFCRILTLIQSKDRKNYEVYDEKKFRTKKTKNDIKNTKTKNDTIS